MDLCLLAMLQLCFSALNLRRLLSAYFFMEGCTIAAAALHMGRVRWAMHLPVLILAAACATGERRPARILLAAFCLFSASACAAGCMLFFGKALPALLIAWLAAVWLLRRRTHLRCRWNVEICAEALGRSSSFSALIDTGNRLREHRSGLPVLIVEAEAAPELCAAMEDLPPAEIRRIPYGALGGAGELACFRAQQIWIRSSGIGEARAPDCYLAIYSGRIPGSTRALAPPEFAEALQGGDSWFKRFQDKRRRRKQNVIFKHETIHLWTGGSNSERLRLLHRRERSAAAAADPRRGS